MIINRLSHNCFLVLTIKPKFQAYIKDNFVGKTFRDDIKANLPPILPIKNSS